MLKDNLIMLRNMVGFSQEEISERLGISRQAYAKWEKGLTIPDIEKCGILAEIYNVSIDYLAGLTDQPRTLDGSPYTVSKNITITQTGNGKIDRVRLKKEVIG